FNRFRLTKRQKKVIEYQKIEVEEKQREIIDSINYARRIQLALMPNERLIEKNMERIKKKGNRK
ncbi:MAG TPA: hypothetical protein VD905_06355, partial [Flavobacteriales bacterium]|nr:hypothetical protein [Flavobacteriales bacterium]